MCSHYKIYVWIAIWICKDIFRCMPSARMVGLRLGHCMLVFLLTIAVIAVLENLKRPVAFKHLEVVCLVGLL